MLSQNSLNLFNQIYREKTPQILLSFDIQNSRARRAWWQPVIRSIITLELDEIERLNNPSMARRGTGEAAGRA